MVETHLKNNYIDWLPVKNGEALLCVEEQLMVSLILQEVKKD